MKWNERKMGEKQNEEKKWITLDTSRLCFQHTLEISQRDNSNYILKDHQMRL
jgi:hypothetical protein